VLGIGVCGTVFANELNSGLVKYAPEAPFELVRHSVEAIYTLPVAQQAGVIHAYVLVILTFCFVMYRGVFADVVSFTRLSTKSSLHLLRVEHWAR
jgi:hypothetical protein